MSYFPMTGRQPRRELWVGIHVCHVCATRFKVQHPEHMGGPQPPCCPACEAPARRWRDSPDTTAAYFFLHALGGAPYGQLDDTFAEFRVLRHVRTYADIDAFLDDVRAQTAGLFAPRRDDDEDSDRESPRKVAWEAAAGRLREQLESGLLERRLDELRERTAALLRAEFEHHLHVYAARRGG